MKENDVGMKHNSEKVLNLTKLDSVHSLNTINNIYFSIGRCTRWRCKRHLLTLGCYDSFGYCDTAEALQASTEQRSEHGKHELENTGSFDH